MIIWIMTITFLVSCDKGPTCYDCVITTPLSTDVPTIGFHKFADAYEEKCDMTEEELEDYRQSKKEISNYTQNGIVYTKSITPQCYVKR